MDPKQKNPFNEQLEMAEFYDHNRAFDEPFASEEEMEEFYKEQNDRRTI